MRIRAIPLVFVVMLRALAASPSAPAVDAAVLERYVTVYDDEHRPVLGLTEEDFALRDGGIRQHVLDVRRADAPVAVALVQVGFDPSEQSDATEAMTATGRAITANDSRHLVSAFQVEAGAGHAVLDVLVGACESLQSASTDRRVVLALVRRRPGDGAVTEPARLSDAIFRSRVALWTIEVGPAQTTALDTVLTESVSLGGALRQTIPSSSGMASAVSRLTPLLTAQYVVSYEWPDPVLSQFNLTIRHERGAVLTPAWPR